MNSNLAGVLPFKIAAAQELEQRPVLYLVPNPEHQEPVEAVQPQPLVVEVPSMLRDKLTRNEASRFIGSIAVDNHVKLTTPEHQNSDEVDSLLDGIQLAVAGNPQGRKLVKANVSGDVIERTIKVAHVSKVDMAVDADGEIHQHGHNAKMVQANSLLFASNSPEMAERVGAETNNVFRIQNLYEQGTLNDNSFVEISLAADNMSRKQLAAAGFFVDTMSWVIRVTTANADGGLTTESAFLAGVKELGQERHDKQTVIALGKKLGVDFSGKSAAEILDTPMLIQNNLIPNGAVDLVEMADDCAGGTFFGEAKPRQNYVSFLQKCRQREQSFETKVEEITNELIAEASFIKTEVQATKRLAKISEKHMVEKAVKDKSINPQVFGKVAAAHIGQARLHVERGNIELANAATRRAKSTARSSSCPGEATDGEQEDAEGSSSGSSSKESWHGGKVYRNSQCRSCKETKDEVGACHICKDCVKNPSKRKRSWDEYQASKAKKSKKNDTSPVKKLIELAPVVSLEEKRRAKLAKERNVAKLALTVTTTA